MNVLDNYNLFELFKFFSFKDLLVARLICRKFLEIVHSFEFKIFFLEFKGKLNSNQWRYSKDVSFSKSRFKPNSLKDLKPLFSCFKRIMIKSSYISEQIISIHWVPYDDFSYFRWNYREFYEQYNELFVGKQCQKRLDFIFVHEENCTIIYKIKDYNAVIINLIGSLPGNLKNMNFEIEMKSLTKLKCQNSHLITIIKTSERTEPSLFSCFPKGILYLEYKSKKLFYMDNQGHLFKIIFKNCANIYNITLDDESELEGENLGISIVVRQLEDN